MDSEKSKEELIAELNEIKEQMKKIKETKKPKLKVSDKGCVQINGIRRFPVTFYVNEIQKIFEMKEEILEFIENNKNNLATK